MPLFFICFYFTFYIFINSFFHISTDDNVSENLLKTEQFNKYNIP